MNIKKLIFYICVVLSIFIIYKLTFKDEINYVALGDSVAVGVNPYGEKVYGYPDYTKDYLQDLEKLGYFTKGFSKKGQKIDDLIEDINNNKTIIENGKHYNIKNRLRESNLVTLSIGANDFIDGITLDSIIDKLDATASQKKRIDEISVRFEELLKVIKLYAKGDIIVIGYYNPFPYLTSYKTEINDLVEYSNKKFQQICGKNNVYFVKISNSFDDRTDYLPNPFDIHPTVLGYNEIFKQIKKVIDDNILNNLH